jgi:hypothetical protein
MGVGVLRNIYEVQEDGSATMLMTLLREDREVVTVRRVLRRAA